jgi:hypothetical protein
VIAHLAGDRGTSELDLEYPAAVTLATGGFFNGLAAYENHHSQIPA